MGSEDLWALDSWTAGLMFFFVFFISFVCCPFVFFVLLFALSFDFSVVGYDTVLRHFDHEKAVEEGGLQNLHACQGEERQEELREEKKERKNEPACFCLSNEKNDWNVYGM